MVVFFNDLWNEFGRDNDDGYINFVGNIENVFVDWEFFFVDFNFVVFNVDGVYFFFVFVIDEVFYNCVFYFFRFFRSVYNCYVFGFE